MEILTNERGEPIERPHLEDFENVEDFIEAFHAWKDRVAAVANEAFDAAFRKELARG